MLYLVELLLLLWLVLVTRRLLARPAAASARALLALVGATGAAWLALVLADWAAPRLTGNLLGQLLFPLLAANLVFLVAWPLLGRRLNRFGRAAPPPRRPRLDRLLRGLFAAGFLAGMLLLFSFLVLLFAQADEWRAALAERSLLLRVFLPEAPAPAPEPALAGAPAPAPETEPVAERQRRLLSGLGAGWRSARDMVLDRTGAQAVLDSVAALKVLLNLDPDEGRWLVERNPPLRRLLTHPALTAILESDRILSLLDRAAGGDLGAIYAFGDEPLIRALFADEDFMDAARSLDLQDLNRQIQEYRRGAP